MNETIESLADRLGVPVVYVQALIAPLGREHGHQSIVAVAAGMRTTVLTPFAVEQITAALAVSL